MALLDGVTKYQNLSKSKRLDWQWADRHLQAVMDILKANAMHLLSVQVAPLEDDQQRATDLVITVLGGDVAVRIRRTKYISRFRDLTIRAWRASGAKTELQKIKEGFGRWYLYGWSDDQDKLYDWMLVDCDVLRTSGLLEKPLIMNRDNRSGFIAITDKELRNSGCIVTEGNGL